nr:hypothetical protein [uncultured Pedobacter sp.]
MKRLILFFICHFFIVLTLSIYLTAGAFFKTKYQKDVEIPVVDFLVKNVYDRYGSGYLWLSGLNTGYGFYGINVSTQKFFVVEIYDKNKILIHKDNRFNFNTRTGYMRFDGYAYHIANFMAESDKLKLNNTVSRKMLINARSQYTNKVFQYLGRGVALKVNNADSYVVKLCTIIPHDIWASQKIEKNQVYVEKEMGFSL